MIWFLLYVAYIVFAFYLDDRMDGRGKIFVPLVLNPLLVLLTFVLGFMIWSEFGWGL